MGDGDHLSGTFLSGSAKMPGRAKRNFAVGQLRYTIRPGSAVMCALPPKSRRSDAHRTLDWEGVRGVFTYGLQPSVPDESGR